MRLLVQRTASLAIAGLVLMLWSGNPAGASPSAAIPNSMDAGWFTSGLTPSSASACFVMPTFTCTGVQSDILLVEVNWSTSGSGHGADEVFVNCASAGATPQLSTFVIAGNSFLTGPVVTAGDTLKAVILGSATKSSAQLSDVTTGKGVTASGGPQTSAGLNALVTLGRNDATTPTFSPLKIKALKVDGTLLTSTTSFSQDMTSASSVVQAHAKPITSGVGTIVFEHS